MDRYWEIDFLRGTAVIMMIIFHFFWDLYFFRLAPLEYFSSGWGFLLARSIPVIFLLLVGISLTISHHRATESRKQGTFGKFFKRGLKVFGYGLAVTILTFLAFPGEFIIFGILHLIGISIIIAQ
ncbi:MAG: heparan-alpha-glucosaminide N-acetyltransferase, partial [Candidatus ainarchaeum sp.]|nr:heparan-alpha-glucosaminide N-acetyltransferase [Candidatus ainarchaeum sp.]